MKDLILKHKVIFSVFLVSVIFGGFIFFTISSSVVALVGYSPIWKNDFNEVVDLMAKYHESASSGNETNISGSDFLKDEYLLKNVQKEALTRIIEYKILSMELENINPDWRKSAQSKIDSAISKIDEKNNFEQGIVYLYGMSLNDFKGKILIPQAQFEILSDELKKQNKNYDQWMKDKKKNIDIRIMIDGLEWKNGEVQISQ